MEGMFSANFSQLQLSGSAPLPDQVQGSSRRSTLRRSRARGQLHPHPQLVSREPVGMPGHQPLRMVSSRLSPLALYWTVNHHNKCVHAACGYGLTERYSRQLLPGPGSIC